MQRRIINILSVFFQAIDTLLCRLRFKRPKVVIYMDGGICSQIYIWVKGQYYAEQGFDVRYDVQWFETCGKDQFGNMPRVFELLEMWPQLPFKSLPCFARKFYFLFFKAKHVEGNWLPDPSLKHSIYLYEYWNMPSDEYDRIFAHFFDISLATIPAIANANDFAHCVGIHVRRGDLSKGDNPAYGGVTDGYFLRAIEFCDKKFTPASFIFFSDEPDWVEQNICNHLKRPFVIMRNNKAWEDLWLLAQCPIIIASQGSFGKMAAHLNPEAVLIQCDNKYANTGKKNSYLIP